VAGAGHLFQRRDAQFERYRGELAAVGCGIAGLGAVSASASQTVVGAVGGWALALGAAAATVVCGAAVVDRASTAQRTAHLSTVARGALVGITAGLAATAVLDHLLTWRQITAIAALPAAFIGLRTVFALYAEPQDIDPATVAVAERQRIAAQRADRQFGPGNPTDSAVCAVASPASSPAVPVLDIRGVTFSYGQVQTLFGVSLHVRPGEAVALLGANGAGKTTLLHAVAGLHDPSAGSIHLGGVDLSEFDARSRTELGICFVGHGAALADDLTVAEHLRLFATGVRNRVSAQQAAACRDDALATFPRLAERLGQRASTLSGGEKQMLALAKVLIARPQLVVIDEFSLGLAPIMVNQLLPVIRRIHSDGAALLIVEQSVTTALELTDRAYVMEKGEVVYHGATDQLRADPDLLRAVYLEGVNHALTHARAIDTPSIDTPSIEAEASS
jgi:branched-chain amino acid transport system ATP-binding protein